MFKSIIQIRRKYKQNDENNSRGKDNVVVGGWPQTCCKFVKKL